MRHLIRRRGEPTIMLINVVFLLLAFFVVAGTIAQRPPQDLRLIALPEGTPAPAQDIVVLNREGHAIWPNGARDAASFVAALPPAAQGRARIMPDRAAPAEALVALARDLTAAGTKELRLVAERGEKQ
jgi:biopolymer transport protein ExbD